MFVMDAKREEELRYWNSFSVHVWYEPLQELTFPSSFLSYAPPPQLGRAPLAWVVAQAEGVWVAQPRVSVEEARACVAYQERLLASLVNDAALSASVAPDARIYPTMTIVRF